MTQPPINPEERPEPSASGTGDHDRDEIRPIVTYTVQLSTHTGQASVVETFENDLSSERVQWIRTFAGVIATIRLGAFVSPEIAWRTVVAVSHEITTTMRPWELVDELTDEADIALTVRIAECGPDHIEDADLEILVPPGEEPDFAFDAFLIFREWLCSQPGGPIPRAPRFGYSVLSHAAMHQMIDPTDYDTQAFAPFKCMEVIEREGYLHPHITRFPIDGLEEFGHDRWDEIQLGPGS